MDVCRISYLDGVGQASHLVSLAVADVITMQDDPPKTQKTNLATCWTMHLPRHQILTGRNDENFLLFVTSNCDVRMFFPNGVA